MKLKEEQSQENQEVPAQDAGEGAEVAANSPVKQPDSNNPELKVICDNRKRDIGPLQTKQKKLKKRFLEIGLSCPYCGFWVHSYYTNPKLERARVTLENFRRNSRRSPKDRQRYEQNLVQFKGQYDKVQERAKGLAPLV